MSPRLPWVPDRTLTESGYLPRKVLLYRAMPAKNPIIKKGDYLTPRLAFARGHSEHMAVTEEENQVVVSALLPSDQVKGAYNPDEFIYIGPTFTNVKYKFLARPFEKTVRISGRPKMATSKQQLKHLLQEVLLNPSEDINTFDRIHHLLSRSGRPKSDLIMEMIKEVEKKLNEKQLLAFFRRMIKTVRKAYKKNRLSTQAFQDYMSHLNAAYDYYLEQEQEKQWEKQQARFLNKAEKCGEQLAQKFNELLSSGKYNLGFFETCSFEHVQGHLEEDPDDIHYAGILQTNCPELVPWIPEIRRGWVPELIYDFDAQVDQLRKDLNTFLENLAGKDSEILLYVTEIKRQDNNVQIPFNIPFQGSQPPIKEFLSEKDFGFRTASHKIHPIRVVQKYLKKL